MEQRLSIAERFARALDANDFKTAKPFLDAQCEYDTGKEVLVGQEQIIETYSKNSDWGKTVLDSIEFESRVETMPDGKFIVHYTDRIGKGSKRIVYQCRQILTVGDDGLITKIEHQDIEGEPERLKTFFHDCGIRRPTH